MFKFVLRGLAVLCFASLGLLAGPTHAEDSRVFMQFPRDFVWTGYALTAAEDLGLVPDVSVGTGATFPEVAASFLSNKAWGVELTTLTDQCKGGCKVVFLTVSKPDIALYANRQALADLLAKHGDVAGQKWLAALEAWEDGGKKGPRPPLYRNKNLFAGAFLAGSTKCFPAPATPSIPSLMFAYMSSTGGGDVLDSPKITCPSDPTKIAQDEMGFTSGVNPAQRIQFLLDGTVVAALVAVPQSTYIEELPTDQRFKLVEIMAIGEGPEFPGDGITIMTSSENDPLVASRVKQLECGALIYYDWAKNNHDAAVKQLQRLVRRNDAPTTPAEAESFYQDLLKVANYDGTMSKSLTDRADLWLRGSSDTASPSMTWDFSKDPTLQECKATSPKIVVPQ